VTSLRTGRPGFDSRQGQGLFSSPPCLSALRPTQRPVQWIPGSLSPRVKWPGRRADHSPPSSADVKNSRSYTSTPQYVIMCLIKHRDITFCLFHLHVCLKRVRDICHLTDVIVMYHELTAWSRVLLEKLTVAQLVKKFSALYGTRCFITVFTTARHCPLSWARWIQSTPSHPVSVRSILILYFHLRLYLPIGLFPLGFSTKIS
jgi:hypothetical protein